ncbi:MAG: hypothetical protein GY909_08260 [Oligoflexia bacterium]|nr:hypothetical protein [Oligoflexia bacterium]
MGLRVFLTTFTILLYSVLINAESDQLITSNPLNSSSDYREAYKVIRKAYKEQRRLNKAKAQEQQGLVQLQVCAGCAQINPVINEVNKILRKMIDTKQVDKSKVGDLEQIEKLEAMYIISERDISHQSVVLNDDGCDFYPKEVYLRDPLAMQITEDNLMEIFSFNIPMEKIRSLHIRNDREKTRTYYYRAAPPNDDIVIRVFVPKEGQPVVQYMFHGDQEDIRKKVAQEARKKSLKGLRLQGTGLQGEKKKDAWGGLWEAKTETTDWKFGLEIEQKDNIPRRLTILKGSDSTEIFNDVYIRTNAEVSDRRQGLNLGLGDHQSDYFRVNLKADGRYAASVPFEIETSVISLDAGEIEVNQEENRIRAGLRMGGTQLFHLTGVQNRENGDESIGLSRTFDYDNGGSLSIEFKDESINSTKEQTVWLRYSLDF